MFYDDIVVLDEIVIEEFVIYQVISDDQANISVVLTFGGELIECFEKFWKVFFVAQQNDTFLF